MTAHALQTEAIRGALHKGTVIAFDRDGRPLVRSAASAAPVRCDVVEDSLGPLQLQLGEAVVFCTYADEAGGCVLGRITRSPSEQASAPRTLRLRVDELEVDAKSTITLKTPHGRIALDAQGNLEMVVWTLVAKARRLQKFLAPILRLN